MIGRERNLNHFASCRSPLCSSITKIQRPTNYFLFSRIIIIILIMMSFIVFEFLKAISARLILYTERNYRPKICSFHNLNHRFFAFQFNFSCFFALEEAKKLLKNNDKTIFCSRWFLIIVSRRFGSLPLSCRRRRHN